MITLNEDQLDLLKEMFNLGVGKAAASLSKLANNKYEVVLSLPKLQMMTLGEMIRILSNESNDNFSSVSQKYSGPFAGTAHMLYSHSASLRLVSIMLGNNIPQDQLSDLERDALMEIGNVLLNACLGALSSMFDDEIETELPTLQTGSPEDILLSENGNINSQIIFIRSEFHIKEENLKGYISLFLETDKLKKLLECIDRYNEKLMEV